MLHVAALIVLFNLTPYADLDEALDALEAGKPLQKVSLDVGMEAIRRIRPTTDDEDLERLIKIAQAARLRRQLGGVLIQVIQQRGSGARTAVRALAALPARQLRDLTDPTPKNWAFNLKRLLEQDNGAETDGAILTLLVPVAKLEVLSDLVSRWRGPSPERAAALLQRLGTCREAIKPDIADLIIRRFNDEDQAEFTAPFLTAILALARNPKVAETIVRTTERGNLGPHDAFLRALGATPPRFWKRAAKVVVGYLEADEASRRAAAVRCAGQLLCPELLPLLPDMLASDAPPEVRIAALEALVKVGYRDAPTIDRLIRMLSDRDRAVAKAAYRTLLRKASVRLKLPMRPDAWLAWRRTQKLPEAAPQEDAERLAKQRKLCAVQWRLKYGPKKVWTPPKHVPHDHEDEDVDD